MALSLSSSIATDGLVFYYDAGNTKKSYLGRPTTNLITNGDFAGGLNAGTGGTGSDNPLNEVVQFANPGNSPYCLRSTAVGGNAFTEYQLDLSGLAAGTTYVMSCWYYFDPAWNGTQAVFHSRAFSASGANTATGSDTGTAVETRVVNGVTWTRAYQTITTPADATGTFNWYLGYPSGNTAGFRYFTNVQFEVGSYPSPFVKGTRSNTQTIIDLTNNNTVTATSLTYANDATNNFSFNGSSNYINCGNSTAVQHTAQISMAAWVRPISSTGLGNIMAKNGNSAYRFRIDNGQLWWYVSGTAAIGGSCPNNTWSYCVVTGDTSGLKCYVNGVQVASNATAFTPSAPASGDLYVGSLSPGSEPFNGSIASAQIYNRALTALEVQQNFNALRGRYGV
jgi:hypothetical protein